MAEVCPYHCIGEGTYFTLPSHTPRATTSTTSSKPSKAADGGHHCFHRFEDTFLGSCVNSLRNPPVTITHIDPHIGKNSRSFPFLQPLLTG